MLFLSAQLIKFLDKNFNLMKITVFDGLQVNVYIYIDLDYGWI